MLTRRAYNKGAFVHLFIFHLLIPSYTHTHTDKCSLRNFHFHIFDISYFQRIAYFSLSYIEKFILQATFSTDTRIPKCHTLVPCLTRPRGSARSTFYPQVQWSTSFNRALSQLSRKGNVMGILQPLPCTTVIRNTETLSSGADLYRLQAFSFSFPSLQYTGSSSFFLFLISWGWGPLRSVLHGMSMDFSMTFASWELR